MSHDAVVLGGGIAGLAAAHALAVRGLRITLVERETQLATHASARNAAIYLPVEHDPISMQLAVRQAALLDALDLDTPWLDPIGAVLVATDQAALTPILCSAMEGGLANEDCSSDSLRQRAPSLSESEVQSGVWVPSAGILDVHAICAGLATRLRALGVTLRTAAPSRVVVANGRATGIQLEDGETMSADVVILAGGAWTAELAAAAGAPLPLVPLRRHLFFLDATLGEQHARHPVVWRADEPECYFRPEGAGVLASPCDEVAMEPVGAPPVVPEAAEELATRLSRLAPTLAAAGVRRAWACQRTFAPDRLPIVGPDPRIRGLHFLAGLGGQGMTVALSVAELLARRLFGESAPLAAPLAADRFLRGQDRPRIVA